MPSHCLPLAWGQLGLVALLTGSLSGGLGAIAPPSSAQLVNSTLTVQVAGLQDATGNLCLKLFAGSQGFPNADSQAVQRRCVPLTPTDSPEMPTVDISDLPPGSYAIALYHDRNGDETLNRGAFGMPTEAYGFSNDPLVTTGPPAYRDAVFLLAGAQQTITVQLQYP